MAAAYNLGTAVGRIRIDASDLRSLESTLLGAGQGLLIFGGVAAAGFGKIVGTAAEFESNISKIAAISHSTGDELDRLRQLAIKMGQDTAFGANEASRSFETLAKAGFSVTEIIDGVGAATLRLAAAGDITLDESADVIASAIRTFGLSAKEAEHVANVISGAANESQIDVRDFSYSLKYVGGVANAAGIPIEDVAAAIAVLGENGIKGSTAGTALRKMFISLNPSSKKAASLMKELGLITKDGKNQFFDATGKAKSMSEIIGVLSNATKGLSDEQKLAAFNTLFGNRAMAAALLLTRNGVDDFKKMKAAIGDTSAEEVAKKKLDNLAGSWKKFKSSIETLFITSGSPLQKGLKQIVDFATGLLNAFSKLPPGIQAIVPVILGVVAAISLISGGFLLTFGTILRAISLFKEIRGGLKLAKDAVRGFMGAMKALGSSALTNPYVLLALAIAAVVAALVWLYFHNEKFRKFVDGLWQGIQKVFHAVWNFFANFKENVGKIWDWIKGKFSEGVDWIKKKWHQIEDALTWENVGKSLKALGGELIKWFHLDDVYNWVKKKWEEIKGLFTWDGFTGAVKDIGKNVADAVIPDGFGDKIKSQFSQVKDMWERITGVDFSKVWDDFVTGFDRVRAAVRSWVSDVGASLVTFFSSLPSNLGKFFSELPAKVGNAIGATAGTIGRWIGELLVAGWEAGSNFVNGVLNWFSQLPGQIWEWLVSTYISITTWAGELLSRGGEAASGFVLGVVNWISQLPGRILAFLTTAYTTVTTWAAQMGAKAVEVGSNFVNSIVIWVSQLPGRIIGFVTDIYNRVSTWVVQMIAKAREMGSGFFNGVVNFITGLPARIYSIVSQIPGRIAAIAGNVFQRAVEVGRNIYNGITGAIGDIVGFVSRLIDRVISAIRSGASRVGAAAASFGSAIWNGFKGAMFGSPHTKIEYAMWDMEANAEKSMKGLSTTLAQVDRIAKTLWPIDAPTLAVAGPAQGLTPPEVKAKAAQVQQPPAQPQLVVQGPLVQADVGSIRSDTDIMEVSRGLQSLINRDAAAKGRKILDA